MNIPKTSSSPWGEYDNKKVNLYKLSSNTGTEITLSNYGGIITSWITPDKFGNRMNIVAGFNTLNDYLKGHPYFGALIGRYGNRIAQGKFSLNEKQYSLATNNAENHLHGGVKGFDKVVWDAAILDDQSLKLTYHSADGEEGYPGNLAVTVIYSLNNNSELTIKYEAETDKPTVVNLTSHCYFNLTGDFNNKIHKHKLKLYADQYTPMDKTNIPTGEIKRVSGTPLDFTTLRTIGSQISEMGMGYDDNYVLDNQSGSMALAAELIDPESGRKLETYTTEPGLQFYTGNYLDGTLQLQDGEIIHKHCALCLETQHYPDSPNKPAFPSTVLLPGERYKSVTVYKTSVVIA